MKIFMPVSVLLLVSLGSNAQKVDTIKTNSGNLLIHFLGHGSLMLEYNQKIIHIDPWCNVANYDKLPKADLVLITHHHGDHLDSSALSKVVGSKTEIYWTALCSKNSTFRAKGNIVGNGDNFSTLGIAIKAVPAYNIVNKRPNGEPLHPKGEGNGYIFAFANVNVYVAGDTENIPEMKNFGNIDIAFLPMNLPYTMTPGMVKEAAVMLKPKILYPYHYGETDTNKITALLKDYKDIEVRIR